VKPEEARSRIEAFLHGQPVPLVLVPEASGASARILEPGSGKSLSFRWDEVADALVRTSAQRAAPYLVLAFADGRQVALADVGFAFAPSTTSTGPLPGLPQTFCFRDFRHLVSGAESLLAHEGHEREALAAAMLAIALLDGARTAGFDVSREEQTLDALVRGLEERGARV
jgi:hypothetical protein